jgi:hypothetical protein
MYAILKWDTDPTNPKVAPWIDVVEADWPPGPDYDEDDPFAERNQILRDNGYPELEGMTTYNVGFQRINAVAAYPTYWWNLEENDRFWQSYGRPALEPSQQALVHYDRAYASILVPSSCRLLDLISFVCSGNVQY